MKNIFRLYNNGYGSGNGAPGSGNNGNGGNDNNGNGGGNRPPKRPSTLMMILSALITIIFALMLYNAVFGTDKSTEVPYTEFLKDLEADKVEKIPETEKILAVLQKVDFQKAVDSRRVAFVIRRCL